MFLELKKMILRKRKNGDNYGQDWDYYSAVYRRAIWTANEVVKHYENVGKFDAKDKPKTVWKE